MSLPAVSGVIFMFDSIQMLDKNSRSPFGFSSLVAKASDVVAAEAAVRTEGRRSHKLRSPIIVRRRRDLWHAVRLALLPMLFAASPPS
ncbi:hypothetical protein [Jiella pacifica]|uniref:Uncharacterized protein n=1 Tax=Jiella pacifica TaxID=2696469 RepID=A0A6N9T3B8_9HYPH|nr:hypothetical protein [Jiella pacifica]NDW05867.1 hypothetical protein [Jiella pacifica]